MPPPHQRQSSKGHLVRCSTPVHQTSPLALHELTKFSLPASDPTLTWSQTFLSVVNNSWRFITADGFLGLAFSTRNTSTLFETLIQQGLVDRSRFGIYFGKEFSNTGASPEGILTLGGDKNEHFVDGNLTWIPMSQEIVYQVWRAPLKAISGSHLRSDTNEISSSTVALSLARVIFDTGSGSLSLSEAIKGEAYAAIGFNWTAILSGAHIPRCTEFNSSWTVTFDFGERDDAEGRHAVRLDGAQLARPGFASREEFCYPPFDSRGSYGFGLFGTPLLRQFYSVWDFGAMDVAGYAPRVRFGKLKADMRP